MGEIVMVSGGARSGKSTFAQHLASEARGEVVYLATLRPLDGEMEARVERHRACRSSAWMTVEEPLEAASALEALGDFDGVVILECLTLLVTNILLHLMDRGVDDDAALESAVLGEIDKIVGAASKARYRLVVVTNEVGLGLVPDNRLGRLFRDVAGLANQRTALAASHVYFVISGIPMKVKG